MTGRDRLALYDVVLLRPHQSVSGPPALPMASEPEVATGDLVAVVGYPQNTIEGDVLLVTFGIVAGAARWGEGVTAPLYHVLDAFSGLGGSGSPVVNLAGKVVGMVTHGGVYDETGNVDSFIYAVNLAGQTIP